MRPRTGTREEWPARAPKGRTDTPGDRWYRLRDEYADAVR